MPHRPHQLILLFVDGLGLGPADPTVNPVHTGVCPHLARFLARHARPIDACLGVPGLPQSATGQTALFTGVNAAEVVGRHVEGFPTAALRAVIAEHNVYRRLTACGLRSTFANAYFTDDMDAVRAARRQSVTTVAALSAFGEVRGLSCLLENRAVYHDLTRERLVPRGYAGPLVTPAAAAAHLAALASEHALTVFEFFLTDHAGHAGSLPAAEEILHRYDTFLGALLPLAAAAGITVLLTSDHGNIEDMSLRTHTLNPVPCAVVGPGAGRLRQEVTSLVDVAGAVLRLLAGERGVPHGS